MAKSLNVFLKQKVRKYLDGIDVPYRNAMSLGELIELVRRNNSSGAYSAVGAVLHHAIEEFEKEGK